MAKISKEQRQESLNKSQMLQTWVTYAPLFIADLKRLDDRMCQMNREARGFGVEQEYITPFVREHMLELIEMMVDKRIEEESKRRPSLYS